MFLNKLFGCSLISLLDLLKLLLRHLLAARRGLQGFGSRGALPAPGRRSSRAAGRTDGAHRPLPAASSRTADRDSIAGGGGSRGPSAGSAPATGHLAPGSLHPCRREGEGKEEREEPESRGVSETEETPGCEGAERGGSRKVAGLSVQEGASHSSRGWEMDREGRRVGRVRDRGGQGACSTGESQPPGRRKASPQPQWEDGATPAPD